MEYLHHLACGHVETRKRASRAPVIACLGCVRAEAHVATTQALVTGRDALGDGFVDYSAEHIDVELVVARARARIAGLLGVDADDVEPRLGMSPSGGVMVSAFVVHVDAAQARRLGS